MEKKKIYNFFSNKFFKIFKIIKMKQIYMSTKIKNKKNIYIY